MKKLVVMGECMLELSSIDAHRLAQSFAGDVYNTAVYAKRMSRQVQSYFLTAVGNDSVSQSLIECCQQEQINTQFVFRHPSKQPGLYMINTDDQGERSFTYWRNDSAAKQIMQCLQSKEQWNDIFSADILFFSAISLAIIPQQDRQLFWQFIEAAKQAGVKIAFDANFRPALWNNVQDAQSQYRLAFEYAHMVLPGLEDLTAVFGHANAEQTLAFLNDFDIDEIVLKDGANPVHYVHKTEGEGQVSITPVQHVVDTTSAGDAFNGGYLSARLEGQSIDSAITQGSQVSAYVIQCKGAIVDAEAFFRTFPQEPS